MAERILLRFERNVLRIEAPDRHALTTISPNALVNDEDFILRVGLDSDELEEIEQSGDLGRHQLRINRPFNPYDAKLAADFIQHVVFEFLYDLRSTHDATIGWSMSERTDVAIEMNDVVLTPDDKAQLGESLRKFPLFQRIEFDGELCFEKGRANHPSIRVASIAGLVVLAAALVIIPLFAIDTALDRNPGWRNLFLIVLAVGATAAALGFLGYEIKRGRARAGRLVLSAAIILLVLIQLFQALGR